MLVTPALVYIVLISLRSFLASLYFVLSLMIMSFFILISDYNSLFINAASGISLYLIVFLTFVTFTFFIIDEVKGLEVNKEKVVSYNAFYLTLFIGDLDTTLLTFTLFLCLGVYRFKSITYKSINLLFLIVFLWFGYKSIPSSYYCNIYILFITSLVFFYSFFSEVYDFFLLKLFSFAVIAHTFSDTVAPYLVILLMVLLSSCDVCTSFRQYLKGRSYKLSQWIDLIYHKKDKLVESN